MRTVLSYSLGAPELGTSGAAEARVRIASIGDGGSLSLFDRNTLQCYTCLWELPLAETGASLRTGPRSYMAALFLFPSGAASAQPQSAALAVRGLGTEPTTSAICKMKANRPACRYAPGVDSGTVSSPVLRFSAEDLIFYQAAEKTLRVPFLTVSDGIPGAVSNTYAGIHMGI